MPSRPDLDAIDCAVMDNDERVRAIADAAAGYQPVSLTDHEVNKLLAFLHALTDKSTIDLRDSFPKFSTPRYSLAE